MSETKKIEVQAVERNTYDKRVAIDGSLIWRTFTTAHNVERLEYGVMYHMKIGNEVTIYTEAAK